MNDLSPLIHRAVRSGLIAEVARERGMTRIAAEKDAEFEDTVDALGVEVRAAVREGKAALARKETGKS